MKNPLAPILSHRKDHPLTYRLLGYIILCSSVFALISTALQLYFDYTKDISVIDEQFSQIQHSHLPSLSVGLWHVNMPQVHSQLDGILQFADIVHVELDNELGTVIKLGEPTDQVYQIERSFKVVYDDVHLGKVEVGKLVVQGTLENVYNRLFDKALVILFTQLGKTFIVSIFIVLIILSMVAIPLSQMAHYARKLGLNNLAKELKLVGKQPSTPPDEIDEVVNAINDMRMSLQSDMIKRERAEQELNHYREHLEDLIESRTALLQRREQAEKLVARLSTKFISLQIDAIEQTVDHALSIIGQFFESDYSYIYLISEDGQYLYKAFEWRNSEITHTKSLPKVMFIDEYPWLQSRLGHNTQIPDISLLTGEANLEKDLFEGAGVGSFAMVPLRMQEHLRGIFGQAVANNTKTWTIDDFVLMRLFGDMVVSALIRKDMEIKLRDANEKLTRLAIQDGLTGLSNRRHFDQTLKMEYIRFSRTRSPLSLIICDVDYFKKYNDFYGHDAGDRCLKQVAHILEDIFKRETDLAARYGGEEFAVILPSTGPEDALELANQLRERVCDLQIPHAASPISSWVTVSVGVLTVDESIITDLDQLIPTVDKALYRAKDNGRNRVEVAVATAA
ncbi:GGDEF domain-containing protein [Spartinivicinus ruber]|uniref:GGDEF domain-containing protein n=1 Tax=Spartinivicinus ruber TaxID=2683272 RepID=UPI0013D18E37|nr:GGDEF domain-containing protein [Spartinivicinus ruber]